MMFCTLDLETLDYFSDMDRSLEVLLVFGG